MGNNTQKGMGLDLFIIVSFLFLVMVGIHTFCNPINRKRGEKASDEETRMSLKRPYATRRKKYKKI
ncbi:MAG: hypothetical protein AB1414_13045 [bacterium]